MSLSVNGTNANNPFAYLQSLWQQTSGSSGAQGQSDPLSSLLAGLDQQGAGGTSSAAGTGSSGSTAGVFGSTPQFDSQVLQVLMALQAGGENSTGLASQLGNTIDAGDQAAGQQGQATAQSQTGQHHRHFHMGNMANAQAQDLLNAADGGTTSQTVTNANGSSTTTITYADGSSVAMTTAAPSSSDSSSDSSSSSTGSTVAGNNLIEQLIQMQAQLVNSASTQGIATA